MKIVSLIYIENINGDGDTPFSEGKERKNHVPKNVDIRCVEERDLWM